jgi:hypothetical protein
VGSAEDTAGIRRALRELTERMGETGDEDAALALREKADAVEEGLKLLRELALSHGGLQQRRA